jgi:REP-associated tyrosine transposase
MAGLFLDVLYSYRDQQKLLLHEFVVMPNHFHLLITPSADISIQRAMQFIKGGYSFRAKKELGFQGELWQKSFYDHRVRDWEELVRFRNYVHDNPVRRGLAASACEYPYSSANPKFTLDEVPERLKPSSKKAA